MDGGGVGLEALVLAAFLVSLLGFIRLIMRRPKYQRRSGF